MQKIDFQNLPDTTTPVNASNLNTLQSNVENDINTRVQRLSFSISASSSKTFTFTDAGFYLLFCGRGSTGSSHCLYTITGYGIGGTARYSFTKLEGGSDLSISIGAENTRQITISNSSNGSYTCYFVFLVGSNGNVTIS